MALSDIIEEPEPFQGVFALASVTVLPPSTVVCYSPVFAQFVIEHGGGRFQILGSESGDVILLTVDFRRAQLSNLSPTDSLCVYEGSDSDEKESYCSAISVQCRNAAEGSSFCLSFEQWKNEAEAQRVQLENEEVAAQGNQFDFKIDALSAKMYFHYYGQLLHQEHTLRDWVTIGNYFNAILENRSDFAGHVVVDVGAGCGILSLFAAQAGARHVYAVEASNAAEYARSLIAGNPSLGERITVIEGKVEEVELPELADILISEPLGTLLVNERMIESYIRARDRFLAPNGKMFPNSGSIYVAPFSDQSLYSEIAAKAVFWQQHNYFGVDLTPLSAPAFQDHFSQPVVGGFDMLSLVSSTICHEIDFTSIQEEELYEIDIPLKFTVRDATVHGLACWFGVLFSESTVQTGLDTSPFTELTHWSHLRCVLSQPIYVAQARDLKGQLRLVAQDNGTYTIHLTLSVETLGIGSNPKIALQTSSGTFKLEEPYYASA